MFASLDAPLSGTTASDPLEDWMTSGVIDCKDPVVWWSNQLDSKASTVHPALARMAIDLLSTPGMFLILGSFFVTNYFLGALAEMERGFSRGGLMVSPRRHNLKGASVRAGTVLSSWREIPGLLPEKEMISPHVRRLAPKLQLMLINLVIILTFFISLLSTYPTFFSSFL